MSKKLVLDLHVTATHHTRLRDRNPTRLVWRVALLPTVSARFLLPRWSFIFFFRKCFPQARRSPAPVSPCWFILTALAVRLFARPFWAGGFFLPSFPVCSAFFLPFMTHPTLDNPAILRHSSLYLPVTPFSLVFLFFSRSPCRSKFFSSSRPPCRQCWGHVVLSGLTNLWGRIFFVFSCRRKGTVSFFRCLFPPWHPGTGSAHIPLSRAPAGISGFDNLYVTPPPPGIKADTQKGSFPGIVSPRSQAAGLGCF